jgi:hypothetical protein
MLMLAGIGIVEYGLQHESFADLEEMNFNTVEHAELATEYYSETGTLLGIETGLQLSIENGEYRINTGEWTNETGILNSGDLFQLKNISSDQYDTINTTIRHVDTVSTTFSTHTKIDLDTQAAEIIFLGVENAELDSDYYSETGMVSEINTGIEISAQNCEYRINTGNWTNETSTIYNGDHFSIKIRSANEYQETTTGIVFIGDLVSYFSATTKQAPTDTEIESIIFDNIS